MAEVKPEESELQEKVDEIFGSQPEAVGRLVLIREIERGTERLNGSYVRYPLGWHEYMLRMLGENHPLTD